MASGVTAAAAYAQETIESNPLRVTVDGRGALQVSLPGRSDGEFAPADDEPGRAGLELATSSGHSPVDGSDRAIELATAITGTTTQTATSRFTALGLVVTERAIVTYGDATLRLEYDLVNPTNAPIAMQRRRARRGGRGPAAAARGPNFVGTRDHLGQRVGLLRDAETPWDAPRGRRRRVRALQDRRPRGLRGRRLRQPRGGAQWNLTIPADGTRTIKVAWLFDPPSGDLTVTTTDDHDDGFCDVADCSLREALRYAEDNATIRLGAGTFKLSAPLTSTREGIELIGRGPKTTVIDGANATRLLTVQDGELTVQGVAFIRGNGVHLNDADPFGFARAEDIPTGNGGAIAVAPGRRARAARVGDHR